MIHLWNSKLSPRGENATPRPCAPPRGRRRAALALVSLLGSALSGCGFPVSSGHRISVSEPPAPIQSGPNPDILRALTCMRDSHVLNRIRFGIAVHSDGTGKSSYGYEGATGSFLPQGTAAIWASETVIRAGGLAMNYYELNTERALRQFGGTNLDQALAQQQQARVPNFIVSTAFTALDFLGGSNMDVRVGGIGPYYDVRGASLEVAAEIYRPGDRMTMAISSLNRQVFYRDGPWHQPYRRQGQRRGGHRHAGLLGPAAPAGSDSGRDLAGRGRRSGEHADRS